MVANMLLKTVSSLLLVIFITGMLAQDASEHSAGETRVDAYGIEQVWVPAGCFLMGITAEQAEAIIAADPPSWVTRVLPLEQPQHEVCLTSGYWLDTYEVTNAAYQAFVDEGAYTTETYWSADGWKWLSRKNIDNLPLDCTEAVDDHPRVCVTWYEAEAYANWRGGKLPSEAQWEFAARGPESSMYPWGNEWDASLANVVDSDALTPVGTYPDGISWVGAYDMAGNAMEWTADWLDADYYANSPKNDPAGPESGRFKPERGGWWGSNPFVARSTFRYYEDPPTYQDHHIGFRIVSLDEAVQE